MQPAVANNTLEVPTIPARWEKRDRLQAEALAVLVAILYFPVLIKLVAAWWGDPNFSHGFFVPLFSGLVVWINRKRLAAIPREPSSSGLVVIVLALCALVVGMLGAEFFLSRCSLVLMIAGVLVYLRGWRFFKAVLFPWLCLFLMIPIPTLMLNQITFPLQLFATMFAHWMLVLFGIPVLREGNVLRLPSMSVEVAQACSGIRSFMTLIALAVFYGYFVERTVLRRVVLLLAAAPVAILANGLRIVATCVSVQYWGPAVAVAFFHNIEGLFIVGVAMLMFLLVHRLMLWYSPLTKSLPGGEGRFPAQNGLRAEVYSLSITAEPAPWSRLLFPVVLLLATGAFLYSRSRPERLPPYLPLDAFPTQVGDWRGVDVPLSDDFKESLGNGEFDEWSFSRSQAESPVELFLAFYPTQRTGDSVHSPQHCLPGAGWSVVKHDFLPLPQPGGGTRLVNRYVVGKGGDLRLVLYWYQSHGRVIASEYTGKIYLVFDAITMNRSDGGLVRIDTPITPQEGLPQAQERAVAFAEQILPKLSAYIPN